MSVVGQPVSHSRYLGLERGFALWFIRCNITGVRLGLRVVLDDALERFPAQVQPGKSLIAPFQFGDNPVSLAVVVKAMVGVTQEGTSTRVFASSKYLSGGKTGTAQAVSIGQKDRYNASKMEEHQRDHALYIAFAPADNPTIAVAVIVENAGFGAAHAAPIARRVFDYWVMGQYPSEQDLAAIKIGQATAPIGTPRLAADVAWPPPVSSAAPSAARPASAPQ